MAFELTGNGLAALGGALIALLTMTLAASSIWTAKGKLAAFSKTLQIFNLVTGVVLVVVYSSIPTLTGWVAVCVLGVGIVLILAQSFLVAHSTARSASQGNSVQTSHALRAGAMYPHRRRARIIHRRSTHRRTTH